MDDSKFKYLQNKVEKVNKIHTEMENIKNTIKFLFKINDGEQLCMDISFSITGDMHIYSIKGMGSEMLYNAMKGHLLYELIDRLDELQKKYQDLLGEVEYGLTKKIHKYI